jgi:hypothetical protein
MCRAVEVIYKQAEATPFPPTASSFPDGDMFITVTSTLRVGDRHADAQGRRESR